MSNNNTYQPAPQDTAGIQLNKDLEALAEEMARNVHENWAFARIKEGWRLGPERNDKEKTHPCLVPYDQLPEEEKEYDRITSIETLRFILSKGFTINPI